MKKMVTSILILAVFLASLTGCGSAPEVRYTEDGKQIVTIGYLPITHALAVFETKELLDQDPDSDITIQLQKFSSWTDLMDALDAGQIDGASVLAELAMGAVSQGISLKAAALGHRDGNIVVVSNEINSVEDLRGKTFAIPSNQSSHNILLQDMLATAGMDFYDINAIQLSPPEMPVSLASGSIDGYCVAEPFGTQAVAQEYGHILFNSEELWKDSICCLLVFNGAYAENQSETVNRLLDMYQQAEEVLTKDEQVRIAEEYLGQTKDILEASLEYISFQDLSITEESYEQLAKKVVDYSINACPPDYEGFVYERQ
ncbi:MAG: ABC transporter substrate-binding protein [Lachnospiraceae bacterium]|nr:ABC transporter substrate-binding protein [Lachnospiraceae bacterium]